MPPQHMGMPPQHMGMPPQHMPHIVTASGQQHPVPGGVHAIVPAPQQQRVPEQPPQQQPAPQPSPGASFAPTGGPPLAKAAARKPRNHKNLVIEAPVRVELAEEPAATTPMVMEPSSMGTQPQANPAQPIDAFARATGASLAESPAGWLSSTGLMQPPVPGHESATSAPPHGSSRPSASGPSAEAGPSQPLADAPTAPIVPTQSGATQHAASP